MQSMKWFFFCASLYWVWEMIKTIKILGLHGMLIVEVLFFVTFLFLGFVAKKLEKGENK